MSNIVRNYMGIEFDIDDIASDLNLKLETDLTNVEDAGKVAISGMGMPSSTYTNLTLGADGTEYTAPANGWVVFRKRSSSSGQYLSVNNPSRSWYIEASAYGPQNYLCSFAPVLKGDKFYTQYNAGGGDTIFRFIYAVGSESEA